MTDFRVLAAFAALVAMALFYARLGVRPSLAPLCAVGTTALGLSLFGMPGLLRAGGWLLYLFAAFCAGFLLWGKARGRAGEKRPLCARKGAAALSCGFWFFAAGGLFFILLMWAKQPLFTGWDEFSLWGVAGKLMKLSGELYTTAPAGWTWPTSQKPAYIVFGYFFQFFGEGFSEWQTYAACNVFHMAMMAAVLSPFDGGAEEAAPGAKPRHRWVIAVPAALVALLVPYVFQHYETAASVSPAYLDALADIPMGLCFAAALACGLGQAKGPGLNGPEAPNAKPWTRLLPAALALGLLTFCKDTGLALALVAAVILAVDWLVTARGSQGDWDKKRRLPGFALRLFGGLAVALALFAAWEGYAASLSGASRLDSAVTAGGVGMLEMPFAFFRDWFNPAGMTAERREIFNHVWSGMTRFFFTASGNALGPGLVIMGLSLGMVGLSALVCRDKIHRLRAAAFAVLSTLGFAAWYWLVGLTYIYIFRPEQALSFDSYDRYVYPYYIGWLLGALAFLGVGLVRGKSRLVAPGKAAVLGFAALLLLRVALLIPVPYTVIGVNTQEYNPRRAFNAQIDRLKPYLDEDGRTFFIMSGDLGVGWFMAHHQLLPWTLDYSFGGGDLVKREAQPDGTTLKTTLTAGMLADYLVESGCTTVYVNFASYEFIQAYGELFSDGLAAWENDEAALYTVNVQNGAVTLTPLYWEAEQE